MLDLIALKLITNEEVLGEIESETDTEFVLTNPVAIQVVRGQNGQPNVGFAPFPMFTEQKPGSIITLSKKHVVYSYEPSQEFQDNYNQVFGSGLVIPPKKQIIAG